MAKSSATGFKKSAPKVQFDTRGAQVSHLGVASYAYLKNADTYAGGQATNKITITFEQGKQFQQMVDNILQFENKFRTDKGLPPVKTPACLRKDKVTGNPQITFKVAAKEDANGGYIPIKVFDIKGEPSTAPIWSGDIVRAQFSLGGVKTAMYTGAKPYLLGVQLIKKGANDRQSKVGFSDMSGASLPNETLPDEGAAGEALF